MLTATPTRATPSSTPRRNQRGLELIAAFKFVKAASLIVAGIAALGFLSPRVTEGAEQWLQHLALGSGHRFVAGLAGRVLPTLDAASPRRFLALALGAFVYAAVFLVEGIGLWRGRRWAEYLTIGVTISFLPFEIIALMHRVSLPRAATLVLNVAVVIYLCIQLRSHEQTDATPTPARRTAP